METTTQADLRAHLAHFLDRAEQQHERIAITRNGRPAVVILAADDLDGLMETLDLLSDPAAREAIAEGRADIAAGRTHDEAAVRAALGLAKHKA